MRVNENTTAGLGTTGLERSRGAEGLEAGGAGAQARATSKATDHVNISGLAAQLQALDDNSADREAKLSGLRQAYETGQYQAPAESVADGLMSDAASGAGPV